MKFTTSNGRTVDRYYIKCLISMIMENLNQNNCTFIIVSTWEIEFLEWFLNKKIEIQDQQHEDIEIQDQQHEDDFYPINIEELHITENKLKQLKQLKDYLEL